MPVTRDCWSSVSTGGVGVTSTATCGSAGIVGRTGHVSTTTVSCRRRRGG